MKPLKTKTLRKLQKQQQITKTATNYVHNQKANLIQLTIKLPHSNEFNYDVVSS